jgi:hypothetical protein
MLYLFCQSVSIISVALEIDADVNIMPHVPVPSYWLGAGLSEEVPLCTTLPQGLVIVALGSKVALPEANTGRVATFFLTIFFTAKHQSSLISSGLPAVG